MAPWRSSAPGRPSTSCQRRARGRRGGQGHLQVKDQSAASPAISGMSSLQAIHETQRSPLPIF